MANEVGRNIREVKKYTSEENHSSKKETFDRSLYYGRDVTGKSGDELLDDILQENKAVEIPPGINIDMKSLLPRDVEFTIGFQVHLLEMVKERNNDSGNVTSKKSTASLEIQAPGIPNRDKERPALPSLKTSDSDETLKTSDSEIPLFQDSQEYKALQDSHEYKAIQDSQKRQKHIEARERRNAAQKELSDFKEKHGLSGAN